MRLATWRKREGLTQAELAERLGCSQSQVSQMERAANPLVPGRPLMVKIFLESGGDVEPNDFFSLPAIGQGIAA